MFFWILSKILKKSNGSWKHQLCAFSVIFGVITLIPGRDNNTTTNKSAESLLSGTTGIISIEQIVQELHMFESTCLTPATG